MEAGPSKISTLDLARKLGLVEIINVNKGAVTKYSKQIFKYLFVLDFESTCWDAFDANKGLPEIIEFSVVLYDVKNNKIISEFQQYVMPMERPFLSDFCKKFTGIMQKKVDNGVPLGTCLMLFGKWMKENMDKYKISLNDLDSLMEKGAFVTWSDWDLNICLQNECRRKILQKPGMFNKWIDLRVLYKEHYQRRPKGLNGALAEVGLKFQGTEHCGLHDARNTAILAGQMIADGILLRITKDLSSK